MPDRNRSPRLYRLIAAGILCAALATPGLEAAGFDFFTQGGRATGMAGAYVAQADDPTAIFYNPGGLALLADRKSVSIGTAATSFNEALYQGLPPGIGGGTTGEQETSIDTLHHAWVVYPLGDYFVAGVGAFSPFRLNNEWADADTFAGRSIATASEITTYDVVPTLAFQPTERFGIGLGLIYRSSELSASRRLSGTLAGQPVDIASLSLDTDMEPAFGFTFGMLHKASPRFSWGLSYRSAIETDFIGTGELTQIETGNDQFDELIEGTFPFGDELALASQLSYPDLASLGIAFGLTGATLIELDVNRAGWSDAQNVDFLFTGNPDLNTRHPLAFEDAMSYRLGFRYQFRTGPRFLLGYAFEETPQPDATVGPFLADSDRHLLSAGFGLDWLDVGLSWITYDQRVIRTSAAGLNGNWRANSWIVSVTATK